jgi:hypothetical protein
MKNGCGYSSEQWGVGMFFQKDPPFENSRSATECPSQHVLIIIVILSVFQFVPA